MRAAERVARSHRWTVEEGPARSMTVYRTDRPSGAIRASTTVGARRRASSVGHPAAGVSTGLADVSACPTTGAADTAASISSVQ
jgi:hypothetical protein